MTEQSFTPVPYEGPHHVEGTTHCMIQGLHMHGPNPEKFYRANPGEHWKVGNKCLIATGREGETHGCHNMSHMADARAAEETKSGAASPSGEMTITNVKESDGEYECAFCINLAYLHHINDGFHIKKEIADDHLPVPATVEASSVRETTESVELHDETEQGSRSDMPRLPQENEMSGNKCDRCSSVHKYAGVRCPTCEYLEPDDENGRLFWQHGLGGKLYECDMDDHFFDEASLEVLLAVAEDKRNEMHFRTGKVSRHNHDFEEACSDGCPFYFHVQVSKLIAALPAHFDGGEFVKPQMEKVRSLLYASQWEPSNDPATETLAAQVRVKADQRLGRDTPDEILEKAGNETPDWQKAQMDRAHNDMETISAAHNLIVQQFGGDRVRAAVFFTEFAGRTDILEYQGRTDDDDHYQDDGNCGQCGFAWSHRACGPTHAMIWNEIKNRTDDNNEILSFEDHACPLCSSPLYFSDYHESYFCHGRYQHRFTQAELQNIADRIAKNEKSGSVGISSDTETDTEDREGDQEDTTGPETDEEPTFEEVMEQLTNDVSQGWQNIKKAFSDAIKEAQNGKPTDRE